MSHIEEWSEAVQIFIVVMLLTAPIWIPIYLVYQLYHVLTPWGRKKLREEKKQQIERTEREQARIAAERQRIAAIPLHVKQEPWNPDKAQEYLNKLIK